MANILCVLKADPPVPSELKRWTGRGVFVSQGILMRYYGNEEVDEPQLIVPRKMRIEFLQRAHADALSVHSSIARTYARFSARAYWPGIYHDICKYIRSCVTCQRSKVSNKPPAGAFLFLRLTRISFSLWRKRRLLRKRHSPSTRLMFSLAEASFSSGAASWSWPSTSSTCSPDDTDSSSLQICSSVCETGLSAMSMLNSLELDKIFIYSSSSVLSITSDCLSKLFLSTILTFLETKTFDDTGSYTQKEDDSKLYPTKMYFFAFASNSCLNWAGMWT